MYTEKDYKKDHEKVLKYQSEQHYKGTFKQICAKRKALYDNKRKYSAKFIGKYVKVEEPVFTIRGELKNTIVRYAYIRPQQKESYFYNCVVLEPLNYTFTKGEYFRKTATYYIDLSMVYMEEITKDEWKSVLAKVINVEKQDELRYTDSTIYNYINGFINKHPTKQEQSKKAAMDKAWNRFQKLSQEYKLLGEKRLKKYKSMVTEEIFDKVKKNGIEHGWYNLNCGFLDDYAKPKKKPAKKKKTKSK